MKDREFSSCVHVKDIWFSYEAVFRGEKLSLLLIHSNGRPVMDPQDIQLRFPGKDGWFFQTLYEYVRAAAEREFQEILDTEKAIKCVA